MNTNRKFNLRAMTSLTVSMSFLMLTLSGVILYLSPKGRVANWTGWSMIGLSKEGWGSAHTTMALLFLVASAAHIAYNWRPLLKYLKMPLAAGAKRSRAEMAGALALTLMVFVGTLYSVPPFGAVAELGENIKQYWEMRSVVGPYPHAEEDTLEMFANKLGRGPEELQERLASKGLAVDDMSQTVQELAHQNNMAPASLFALLSSGGAAAGPSGDYASRGGAGGGGFGRKTLAQVCAEGNVDLESAIARLHQRGIAATGQDNVRTLADRVNMTPGELLAAAGIDTGH
ncbi:MAG: DUF4405 domain-containing protein [Candidatus Hydrogenedentes bacterium]|nr:DUF4405 domain-containing protein [Candidatus Hydrogenedentota bacterium]